MKNFYPSWKSPLPFFQSFSTRILGNTPQTQVGYPNPNPKLWVLRPGIWPTAGWWIIWVSSDGCHQSRGDVQPRLDDQKTTPKKIRGWNLKRVKILGFPGLNTEKMEWQKKMVCQKKKMTSWSSWFSFPFAALLEFHVLKWFCEP